jgi:hypothetical protein
MLWTNGDGYVVYGGLGNNYSQGQIVLNEFAVTGGGWDIDQVWSEDFTTGGLSSATASWEILSGVPSSPTLVASGSGSAATLTELDPNTYSYNGVNEYQVAVSGLNVLLAPGNYWLAVWPDNTATGTVENTFVYLGPGEGATYTYNTVRDDYAEVQTNPFYNTSAGVLGTAVPEPSTFALALAGLVGASALALGRKRKRWDAQRGH